MSDCIIWVGATTRGYGVRNIRGKVRYVHRLVCIAVHGNPPTETHLALHRCNTPRCINPEHLYWGTKKDNAADAIRDGVFPRGERHGLAKLDADRVRFIRRDPRPSHQLAKTLGVAASTIRGIRNGSGNWRWLQ